MVKTGWNEKIETVNAQIESTSLGGYDGIGSHLTAYLYLKYDGGGQGFGGYVLGGEYAWRFISRVLEVVGVERWEQLKGKYVRVRQDMSKVHEIGNILEEKWFNPTKEFEKLKEMGKGGKR